MMYILGVDAEGKKQMAMSGQLILYSHLARWTGLFFLRFFHLERAGIQSRSYFKIQMAQFVKPFYF